jgi:dienelactone hydrolase
METGDAHLLTSQGFKCFEHEAQVSIGTRARRLSHFVFHAGRGPALIVMHELPGLVQPCVDLAKRLAGEGFQVFMPHLLGPLMRRSVAGNIARLCIRAEFAHLRSGTSTPVSAWLRSLAQRVSTEFTQPKVGVLGMCLTGGFAIPLLLEDNVRAAVVSQPGVPFSLRHLLLGGTHGRGPWERALNVADEEINAAAREICDRGKAIMIQRFDEDRICPRARVERLRQAFGSAAEVFPTVPKSPTRPPSRFPPHAMLTEEFDAAGPDGSVSCDDPTRQAYARVVRFFKLHLGSVD